MHPWMKEESWQGHTFEFMAKGKGSAMFNYFGVEMS
jgi:hypothetical protein